MTDWETRYYEQQALHTESNGMLTQERDRARAELAKVLQQQADADNERDAVEERLRSYAENLKGKALFVVGILDAEGFPKVAAELAKAAMADELDAKNPMPQPGLDAAMVTGNGDAKGFDSPAGPSLHEIGTHDDLLDAAELLSTCLNEAECEGLELPAAVDCAWAQLTSAIERQLESRTQSCTKSPTWHAARCCPCRVTCEREQECSGLCPVRCRPDTVLQVNREVACENCKGLAEAHNDDLREIGVLRGALAKIAAMLNITKADRAVMREAEMLARATLATEFVAGTKSERLFAEAPVPPDHPEAGKRPVRDEP